MPLTLELYHVCRVLFYSHHALFHCDPFPPRNLSIQVIEFALGLFQCRKRLHIRHALDLAEAIDRRIARICCLLDDILGPLRMRFCRRLPLSGSTSAPAR